MKQCCYCATRIPNFDRWCFACGDKLRLGTLPTTPPADPTAVTKRVNVRCPECDSHESYVVLSIREVMA